MYLGEVQIGELQNEHLFEDEMFSDITAEEGQLIAQQASQLLATVMSRPKDPNKARIKAVCGNKPIFGGRKKDAWRACAEKVLIPVVTAPSYTPPQYTPQEEEEKKFLGMPKAVGITVTVVVALGLIVGTVILIKKARS